MKEIKTWVKYESGLSRVAVKYANHYTMPHPPFLVYEPRNAHISNMIHHSYARLASNTVPTNAKKLVTEMIILLKYKIDLIDVLQKRVIEKEKLKLTT